MAAMLSTMLYNRRFFPYYVYNIVGGLDEQGGFTYTTLLHIQFNFLIDLSEELYLFNLFDKSINSSWVFFILGLWEGCLCSSVMCINDDCVTGRGAVYSYDPVGSYEREEYRAGGSAGAILQPLLDNQASVCVI